MFWSTEAKPDINATGSTMTEYFLKKSLMQNVRYLHEKGEYDIIKNVARMWFTLHMEETFPAIYLKKKPGPAG
jgi:hypothetical protein